MQPDNDPGWMFICRITNSGEQSWFLLSPDGHERPMSPYEIALVADRHRNWNRNQNREPVPSNAATQRAIDLFYEILPERLREVENRYGGIVVNGKDGRRYWVGLRSRTVNIGRIDDDGYISRMFCCRLEDLEAPLHDHLLAQILFLKGNPRAFFKKAQTGCEGVWSLSHVRLPQEVLDAAW